MCIVICYISGLLDVYSDLPDVHSNLLDVIKTSHFSYLTNDKYRYLANQFSYLGNH